MKRLISLFAASAILFGCGEESTSPETPQVSSIYELGECTSSREGESAYVVSEKAYYTCSEKKWTSSTKAPDTDKAEPDGFFTDPRDGRVYKTVTLGTRTWMAENLNYAYNDGKQSFCYMDQESFCEFAGRLYTWSGAMKMDEKYDSIPDVQLKLPHQGICPEGWHVSTVEDWEDLVSYVDAHNGKATVGWSLMDQEGWYVFPAYNNSPDLIKVEDYYGSDAQRNSFGFNLRAAGTKVRSDYFSAGDSSLTWVATNDYNIEHIYIAAGWPFLGMSSCLVYDDITQKERCSLESYYHNPEKTFRKKHMGKPVRCVSNTIVNKAQPRIKIAATTATKGVYDSKAQTLLDKRDGKIYKTTKVNDQVWMAEDLDYAPPKEEVYKGIYSSFNDSICNGKYCSGYEHFDGHLYNWNAVMGIPQEYSVYTLMDYQEPWQGICPGGWHVPSYSEWEKLLNYAKSQVPEECLEFSIKYKEHYEVDEEYGETEEDYYVTDEEGTPCTPDKFGLALGNQISFEITDGVLRSYGERGFWTSTKDRMGGVVTGGIWREGLPDFGKSVLGRSVFLPVRCIMD